MSSLGIPDPSCRERAWVAGLLIRPTMHLIICKIPTNHPIPVSAKQDVFEGRFWMLANPCAQIPTSHPPSQDL